MSGGVWWMIQPMRTKGDKAMGSTGDRNGINAGLSIDDDGTYHSHAIGDGGVGGPKQSEQERRLMDHRLRVERERREGIKGMAEGQHNLGVDELLMVLKFLPRDFLWTYMALIDRGLGERNLGSGGGAGDTNVIHGTGKKLVSGVSSSDTLSISAARRGKGSSQQIGLKDDRAVGYRKNVDRKLRKILREVRVFLNASEQPKARQCVGRCKKFGDAEWLYCPSCGGPMAEKD